MVFVEGAFVLGHADVVPPSFRDGHHDDFGKVAAGHHQHFQSVVEFARVAATFFDDRNDVLHVFAKGFAGHQTLASGDPVAVAAQCVNFAVVSHPTQRLGSRPRRQCVGRES